MLHISYRLIMKNDINYFPFKGVVLFIKGSHLNDQLIATYLAPEPPSAQLLLSEEVVYSHIIPSQCHLHVNCSITQ